MKKFTSCTEADFKPTQWDTAADKLDFVEHFCRFVSQGFPEALFTKKFYNRLSMTFGHIAHYNRGGFWATYFTTSQDKLHFLEHTFNSHPCGDATFTYSDAERAIIDWLHEHGDIMVAAVKRRDDDIRAREMGELSRLQAKYGLGT